MARATPVAWLIAALLTLVAVAIAGAPSAQTKYGTVVGFSSGNTSVWLGIPYAAPPLASLRWAAPQPPATVPIRQATVAGYACPQTGPFAAPGLNTSEDCLYLNVYAPASARPGSKLAVKVWIHGGGFSAGSGIQFDGTALAAFTDTIVVTFNYRIGIWGFYALPGLLLENETLNYGLQDQVAALNWVKLNIAAFGGDPNNVTIFGESAGGGSVHLHLWMPMSHGLFQRAIMESAGPWMWYTLPQMLAMNQATLPTPCSGGNPAQVLACMRNLTTAQLSTVHTGTLPVIDGQQVTDQPLAMWAARRPPNCVPLIVGTNLVEGNLFNYVLIGPSLNISAAEYQSLFKSLLPLFLPATANETFIQELYKPIADGQGYYAALSAIQADLFINCGSFYVADAVSALRDTQVYRYLFEHSTQDWYFAALNATHTAEIPYVWHTDGWALTELTPSEWALADQVTDLWDHFAKYGIPGPQWPLYSRSALSVLGLQVGAVAPVPDPQNFAACKYWTEILGGKA